MVNRFEHFSSTISAIYRDIQKIERDVMEKYGLRGAFAQYLLVMDRFPEGVTATKLCELCDKDKAAVSRILSEMESKDLIMKDSHSTTPYKARHKLTQSGRDAAQYVRQKATVAVELADKGLSETDRKTMYDALNLIASNLQTICHSGIPTFNKEIEP